MTGTVPDAGTVAEPFASVSSVEGLSPHTQIPSPSPKLPPAMIRVHEVTKRYGSVVAVDDASFTLEPGSIVGFLGPNGAGKSTLLKMLCTWLEPDAGSITVAGFDTVRQAAAVRRSIGYLPEHNALYDGMRVDRFLRFIADMHGLVGDHRAERTRWVVEHCALEPVLRKRVGECSKGFRQRIGLAAALIHDPHVILLDEPTHGLDPLQVVAFREFIRGLRTGRTILFSSHILSEVQALCDRVLVIHQGRMIADAPVAQLEREAKDAHTSVEHVVLERVRAQTQRAAAGEAR
jgi:ABC-2 type transport system ATP-binding protein